MAPRVSFDETYDHAPHAPRNAQRMETVDNLAMLPLQDATLLRLTVEWQEGVCTAEIRGALRPGASTARLRWTGVTSIDIPPGAPWGPSALILEGRGPLRNGRWEMTMQSGDMIAICAAGCAIELDPRAGGGH